jgi:Beta-propeller repeat
MKKLFSFVTVLAFGLISCQQNPKLEPSRALGVVEISFDAQNKTSSARMIANRSLLPNQDSVAFGSKAFSVQTSGTQKYLSAQFYVSNNTTGMLEDLTLIAYHQSANQADTAIKSLQNFAGLSSTQLDMYARAAKPNNAPSGFSPFTTNDTTADLQVFTETETGTLETEASSLLGSGEYLFPYGFVARASSTSRSLATGAQTGTITIGLSVPDSNEPSSSAQRFKMTFVVFAQPVTARVTESYEERNGASSASARASGFGASDIAHIDSMTVSSGTIINGVRTAGNSSNVKNLLGERSWQLGSTLDDQANGVAIDSSGNVYVAGYTRGDLDGNTSTGTYDGFLTQYNSSGVKQWTHQFGGDAGQFAFRVTVDSSNNIWVTGTTEGTFDGNTSSGNNDAFIVKYNSGGTKLWTKLFGTSNYDTAISIATDSSNNAYVVGGTSGGFAGFTNAGQYDMFIIKIDPGGNTLWTQQLGSGASDVARGVTLDASGNAYVTGETQGAIDGHTSAGINDVFLIKYNASGTKLWSKQFGSANAETSTSIALDSSGNIYITGQTDGDLDGNTNATQPLDEVNDLILVKFDASGTKQWTQQLGSTGEDLGNDLKVDSSDNIFVAGITTGNFDGHPNSGSSDLILIKYNSSGTKLWSKQLGTDGSDLAYALALDSSDNIFVAAQTGRGVGGNTNAGSLDAMLVRFDGLDAH